MSLLFNTFVTFYFIIFEGYKSTVSLSLSRKAQEASTPDGERQELFAYFGTFSRSMLSMFEITLGNWPVVARILQDNVAEAYMLWSIAHKITIGFALVGILNAVFMQETFKVASSDDEIMMRQKRRERTLHRNKMETYFCLRLVFICCGICSTGNAFEGTCFIFVRPFRCYLGFVWIF